MSTTQRMAAQYDARMAKRDAIWKLKREAERRIAFNLRWMPQL